MKTLMVTGDETQAWRELLGENVIGLFDDNGGDPDGNAWLPFEFIDSIEGAAVIGADLGVMVGALWLDDEEIAQTLGIEDVLALAEMCEDWDAFCNAVDDRVQCWAHYNGYGTDDSRWVIVRK